VPCTPKAALRDDADAFVCHGALPVLCARTSGTTGDPIRVAFSQRELTTLTALSALGFLLDNQLGPEDVVYLGAPLHGIGTLTFLGACTRIGAFCLPGGILPAETTLRRLAEPVRMPGKKALPSVLVAPPSYLGELVEEGIRHAYRPADFGIERILTGGEAVTAGLQARLPALFGEAAVIETYGMTETFGAGGQVCAAGHLHFHPAHALVEVIDTNTGAPAAPSHVGTLVVTPLPPFRETTILLRYDTEDLVTALPAPPTCELRGLPAVGPLLGKRRLSLRHETGWAHPRDLLEALEAMADVPLPARCGMSPVAGGVAVEALVRTDEPGVRRRIAASLEARGLPLRALRLVTSRTALRRPLPLRCDLRDGAFSPGLAREAITLPLVAPMAVG
jgi:phenylacetate-coenzyme A ligase PaaK-like adenylate-forming protein